MAQASLTCYLRPEGRLQITVLEGTLDMATAPQAAEFLEQCVKDHGPSLAVDASRLDFIDSKGVGALLAGAKAAREAGGNLFLHNPALPVRKIVEMCGLTAVFPPLPDEVVAVIRQAATEATVSETRAVRPSRRAAA